MRKHSDTKIPAISGFGFPSPGNNLTNKPTTTPIPTAEVNIQ